MRTVVRIITLPFIVPIWLILVFFVDWTVGHLDFIQIAFSGTSYPSKLRHCLSSFACDPELFILFGHRLRHPSRIGIATLRRPCGLRWVAGDLHNGAWLLWSSVGARAHLETSQP